jgi:hypothetical protein
MNVAGHIIALIGTAGEGAVLICEERLTGFGGELVGVGDLIIDGSGLHAIVDYKTGTVLDAEGEVLVRYREQLQLYAALERERSGRWPSRGLLLRFGGAPIEVQLDPDACLEAADAAIAALHAYNATEGHRPVGKPAEGACGFCPYAPRCDDFWRALMPSWRPLAVAGRVRWLEQSRAGSVTFGLDIEAGSIPGQTVIRRFDPGDGRSPEVGDRLAICGLVLDGDHRLVANQGTRWHIC